jgi:hypothetical protein
MVELMINRRENTSDGKGIDEFLDERGPDGLPLKIRVVH